MSILSSLEPAEPPHGFTKHRWVASVALTERLRFTVLENPQSKWQRGAEEFEACANNPGIRVPATSILVAMFSYFKQHSPGITLLSQTSGGTGYFCCNYYQTEMGEIKQITEGREVNFQRRRSLVLHSVC